MSQKRDEKINKLTLLQISSQMSFSDFHAFKSIKCICTLRPIIQLKIWQVLDGPAVHPESSPSPLTIHRGVISSSRGMRQSLTSPSRHHNVHKDGVQISFLSSEGVWVRLVVNALWCWEIVERVIDWGNIKLITSALWRICSPLSTQIKPTF